MKKIAGTQRTYTLENLTAIVDELYGLKPTCKIYTFVGDLGAGKTTLVKALLKKFGVRDPVTSPTFSYVNTYINDQHEKLHHFDLYRLSNIDEFLQAGFDEFLHDLHSWVFIEWPEIIEPLLQHNVCKVVLDYDPNNHEQRIITYQVIE